MPDAIPLQLGVWYRPVLKPTGPWKTVSFSLVILRFPKSSVDGRLSTVISPQQPNLTPHPRVQVALLTL